MGGKASLGDESYCHAERDFLLARLAYGDHEWVGLSSDAMLVQALLDLTEPSQWPHDDGDLGRCEETYRRAPAHLQRKMLPTLERFRKHVAVGGLHCSHCDTSGHHSLRYAACRACQESDPIIKAKIAEDRAKMNMFRRDQYRRAEAQSAA